MARVVIPHACRSLAAPQPGVRVTAVQAIALLAVDAEPVLAELERAVRGSDVDERMAAASLLDNVALTHSDD